MRKELLKRCGLVLMGAAALTACTDSKYDLNDIDGTMHLGSGTLTLPASSTDSIYLGNLFDLAADGPIKKIADPNSSIPGDSIYYLDVEGSADPTTINIEDITIKSPTPDAIEADMLLATGGNVKGQRKAPQVGDAEAIFQYDIQNDATYDITTSTTDPINDDVQDIKHIGIDPVVYTLSITLSNEQGNIDIIKKLHFDDLNVTLPKGFDVQKCTYQGKNIDVSDAYNGKIIICDKKDIEGYDPSGEPLVLTLTIDGATLADTTDVHFFRNLQGQKHANLEGNIQLHGFARVYESDIDGDKLATRYQAALENKYQAELITDPIGTAALIGQKMQALSDGNYDEAIAMLLPSIHIYGPNDFNKDFVVNAFSGALRHEVEKIDDIELNDLPDFLEDDEVTLNLRNPQVFLKLFTSLETAITTDIQMIPYKKVGQTKVNMKDENNQDVVISIDNIEYDGASRDTLLLCIAKDTTDIDWPAEYRHLTYRDKIQVENIGDLIKRVPDLIGIKGKNGSEKLIVNLPNCDDVSINNDYDVEFSYKVFNPLTFGEGFKIVYKDEDTGWDIADDLKDIDINTLEFTAVATSNVPLALKLTATPLDAFGNPVNGITVSYKNHDDTNWQAAGLEIPANALDANVRIRITATDGSLKNLDGLRYRADLTGEPSEHEFNALRTKSYLRLYNIRLSIVDGVTIKDE